MKPLKAYYAHPMALYGSPIEKRDIETLKRLGFQVINPAAEQYSTLQMEEYVALATSCDLIAFRSFPDGKIGSGMFLEVEMAQRVGRPVIEMAPFLSGRVLTRNETRERMLLPPLLRPDTAPIRTFSDDPRLVSPYPDGMSEYDGQDWGNS